MVSRRDRLSYSLYGRALQEYICTERQTLLVPNMQPHVRNISRRSRKWSMDAGCRGSSRISDGMKQLPLATCGYLAFDESEPLTAGARRGARGAFYGALAFLPGFIRATTRPMVRTDTPRTFAHST